MKKFLTSFLVTLLSGFLLLPIPNAFAADNTAISSNSGTFNIKLNDISPEILQPGQDLTVKATVTNVSGETQSDVNVNLRINPNLLVNRDQLDYWAQGHPDGFLITSNTISNIAPGQSTTTTLTTSEAQYPQEFNSWGTRGISVDVTQGNSEDIKALTASFIVIDTADQYEPINLIPLAALTSPQPKDSSGMIGPIDNDLVKDSPLEKTLTTIKNNPISTAVDPALVEEASKSTTDDGKSWYQNYLALGDKEVINLPAFDPDVVAVARTSGNTPYKTFVDTIKNVGTITPKGLNNIIWPADGVIDPNLLGNIATNKDTLILDSNNFSSKPGISYTPDTLTSLYTQSGTATNVLVADHQLSQLFSDINATSNETQITQRFLAETATITRELPNSTRNILFTTNRNWNPDPTKVQSVFSALKKASWVKFTNVATATDNIANDNYGTLSYSNENRAAEIDSDLISKTESTKEQLLAFSKAVAGSSNLNEAGTTAYAEVASASFRKQKNNQKNFFNDWQENTKKITDSIQIVKTSNLNLLTDTAEVRFLVINNHNEPVNLKIDTKTSNTKLKAAPPPHVEIAANRQVNFTVKLTAVGTGDSVLTLTPESPDGSPVASPTSVHVSLHVTWATWTTNIIFAFAGILIVFGIYRTIKKNSIKPKPDKETVILSEEF
ncbi:MAG: DUF6049 family protein [Micrococcaceae bacterium]